MNATYGTYVLLQRHSVIAQFLAAKEVRLRQGRWAEAPHVEDLAVAPGEVRVHRTEEAPMLEALPVEGAAYSLQNRGLAAGRPVAEAVAFHPGEQWAGHQEQEYNGWKEVRRMVGGYTATSLEG